MSHRAPFRRLAGLLVVAGLGAACTPYRVTTDFDEAVAFGRFRTFAWMDTATRPDTASNPFLERRLRRSVELVMEERGLGSAPTGQADLLVTAFVIGPTSEEVRRSRWYSSACGPSISIWFGRRYPTGFSRRRDPWPFRSPFWRQPWGYACTYRVGFGYVWFPLVDAPGDRLAGTLVIDVLDRESRELLWRGSAEGALPGAWHPDQPQQADVDEIVRQVLRGFPPR